MTITSPSWSLLINSCGGINTNSEISKLLLKLEKYRIGSTPLIRIQELEQLYDIPSLLVKDESENEFGTFKDRRNKLVLQKAIKEDVDKLALITSGSTGYSLVRLAEGIGIKVVCIIDKKLELKIKRKLRKYSYKVIETDLSKHILSKEDVIKLARESEEEVIWDVSNGYHEGLKGIVDEIKEENPDWLITPLGSGESYVGFYEGLKEYGMKTKLVGVGVHQLIGNKLKLRGEPSIADKLYTPFTPYKLMIESTLREGHIYISVSDEEIQDAYEKAKRLLRCEPSSAVVFAALPKLDIKKNQKVIVINSGRVKWE